jgi:hypothetical protein
MTLDDALQAAAQGVPGCLYAGLVDLDQGLPLARAPEGPLTYADAEHLAALGSAYLASAEADAVAEAAGRPGEVYDEAVALTAHRVAVFQRLPGRTGVALCVLAEGSQAPSAVADAARGHLAALAGAEWPA